MLYIGSCSSYVILCSEAWLDLFDRRRVDGIRVRVVANFLARNEFDHLEQLRDLECEPGLWLGAKILTDGEIDFVKRMAYTLAEDPVKRVREQLQ